MQRRTLLALLSGALLLSPAAPPFAGTPEPGDTLPETDIRVPDRKGRETAIDTLLGDNGAAILFIARDCPAALAGKERIAELLRGYQARGIATVVVEVTPRGAAPTDPSSFEALTYLIDEGGRLAVTLGVLQVPEVLVLDGAGRLAYRGAPGVGPSGRDLLGDALEAVAERRAPEIDRTEAVGCPLP